jgi:anti-sigma regulatory factor (Ser/Thr protein kinase)
MREGDLAVAVPALNAMTPESAQPLRYARSYPGRKDQLRQVRAFLREVLAGLPRADDAVTLASEFSANACLHSRSGAPGGVFTVRAEVSEGNYLYIAVEDQGGPCHPRARQALARHGLDMAQGIAGSGNWGITGDATGRLAWARMLWPGTSPATMPAPSADEDVTVDLDKLAIALAAYDLEAQLEIRAGDDLPYLAVHVAAVPLLTCRVYAQADWFFWPHAERIAARDDVPAAAITISRYLGAGDGVPDA